MAINFANVDAQIPSTAGTLAKGPPTGSLVFTQATVTNTDSIAHPVTIYRVANGGTAGPTNIIGMDAVSVAAGATMPVPIVGQVLFYMQTLQGVTNTAGWVNFNASWVFSTS